MDKKDVMSMMNCDVSDNFTISFVTNNIDSSTASMFSNGYDSYTCWDYWQNDYYPLVIRESYPVYLQERAQDKGKKAFEIIKMLKDKKLIKLEKVSDFINAMDALIKIL